MVDENILELIRDRMGTHNRKRMRVLVCVLVVVLSGCAGTRQHVVASWEPSPGARVAYMLEIGAEAK